MRPLALVLCLLATATTAFAQQQQASQRYRLERIVVEGSRVDDTIVRAEARLVEEQMYGDEDFRQAVYRIRRLPFVADAVWRLEPGVTAGGTTLIITIHDVAVAFYDVTGFAHRQADGETVKDYSAIIGGRWMLNNLGVLEGAFQKQDYVEGINFGMAYRAYDIMGTGGYATGVLTKRFKTKVREYDPTYVLTLGYPLTQKQSVTLTVSHGRSSVTTEFDVNNDDDEDEDDDSDQEDNVELTDGDALSFATLRWWYESIDDPIFATRGLQVSAGPNWARGELTREAYSAALREKLLTELTSESFGLGFDAVAYHTLFGRTVGFVRFNGTGQDNRDSDSQTLTGQAGAGLAFDFHTHEESALRKFKARLEVSGTYRKTQIERPELPEITVNDNSAEAAFVMRHGWGTLRLVGTYVND